MAMYDQDLCCLAILSCQLDERHYDKIHNSIFNFTASVCKGSFFLPQCSDSMILFSLKMLESIYNKTRCLKGSDQMANSVNPD